MTGKTAPGGGSAGVLVVVMGVSASGKSSVGRLLADELGAVFVDADDLHPAENVERMSRGVPLTDDDRWPWLDAVGRRLSEAGSEGLVIACSALRREYRDRLRLAAPGVVFIHLDGDRQLLQKRAIGRQGHFMPPHLLDSQLDTLEPLADDEHGTTIHIGAPASAIALSSREWLLENTRVGETTGAV